MAPREYQDLVQQWQDLEREAAEAERKLKDLGQLAASPEAAAWIEQAFSKRRAADACLLRLLRSLDQSSNDTEPT